MDLRGVAFAACLVAAVVPWLAWTIAPERFPMTLPALAIVAAAGGLIGSFESGGNVAAALFSVLTVAAAAERLPLARAAVVAGAAAAGLLIAATFQDSLTLLALAAAMPAAGFVTGLARQQYILRAEQAELLLAEAQRTREEQARAAALDERVRIAREVHDVLAHTLAALAIQLEVAETLLVESADVDGATQRVQRSRQLAVDGLDETRKAVSALREDGGPLPEALERLVDAYREETGGEARLEVVGQPRELDADVRLALQRIAREALTNVRKHAPDAAVEASPRLHRRCHAASAQPRIRRRRDAGAHRRRVRHRGHARAGRADRRPGQRGPGRGWLAGRGPAPGMSSEGSHPLRIAVADDQTAVREGLATLLDLLPGITVVGTAADGEEAVELVEREHPDVVLMDLRMPGCDGVEATRRIRTEHPETQVVVLTTYADDESILQALHAGARGYLTKDAGRSEIARAIEAAAAGQSVLDPAVQARLLAVAGDAPPPAPPGRGPTDSPRARSRCWP